MISSNDNPLNLKKISLTEKSESTAREMEATQRQQVLSFQKIVNARKIKKVMPEESMKPIPLISQLRTISIQKDFVDKFLHFFTYENL